MAFTKSIYFSPDFTDCLTAYVSGISNKRTAEEAWGAVRVLCNYLEKDFLVLTGEDVSNFFGYLASRVASGTLKCTTYNLRLGFYCKLAEYLEAYRPELGFNNPFSLIRPLNYTAMIKPSRIPSLQEIDTILEASKSNLMFYLIMSLAFRVALSSSDICNLKIFNVHQGKDGLCLHFHGTGRRDEIYVPLPSDISELLKTYLSSMTYVDDDGHLFYNKYAHPLTLRNLDAAVAKFVKMSGVSAHYTLQDLRSRSILDMVSVTANSGGDMGSVGAYARIRDLRLNTYVSAAMLVRECPAELVNLRVSVPQLNSITSDAF